MSLAALACHDLDLAAPGPERGEGHALRPAPRSPEDEVADVLAAPALADLIRERIDQVARHGHATVLDDRLTPLVLPSAAFAYLTRTLEQLLPAGLALADPGADHPPATWLLDAAFRPRRDPRANLVKAAALLLAAIERIDRSAR